MPPPWSRWSRSRVKRLCLKALRGLEAVLPWRVFYGILYPYAWYRSRRHPSLPPGIWPACLGGQTNAPAASRRSRAYYLNDLLVYVADRLALPRWLKRCEIDGLQPLQEAHRRGPVIVAMVHFGAMSLSVVWLRAHGVPATALMLGTREESRTPLRRYADRYLPFPEMPCTLHLDQLRELKNVLAAGGIVLVAVDVAAGRQVEIPIGDGTTFRMAAGAIRLAASHGATLLPFNIVRRGPWRFRIELGQPVPAEHLTGSPNFVAAGGHLLAEMLPIWRRHPEQCSHNLIECFQQFPLPDEHPSARQIAA